jgi:hypothetical protein
MYDTISVHIPDPRTSGLPGSLPVLRESYNPQSDKFGFFGLLGNLRVYNDSRVTHVEGSIAKFHLGSNCQSLTRNEITSAFQKLSDSLGLDIRPATVSRVDLAHTFEVSQPVQAYLRRFAETPRYKMASFGGGETITYTNGFRALSFYDKRLEMLKAKERIPVDLAGNPLLRYEMQLRHRLCAQLKLSSLTIAMLTDEQLYHSLIERWRSGYFSILKKRDSIESISLGNVRDLCSSLALLGAQHVDVDEIQREITRQRKCDEISKSKSQRLRRALRNVVLSKRLTCPFDSIAELDRLITEVAESWA